MRRLLLFIFISVSALGASAQTQEYTMLHQGNRAYRHGDWAKAEQFYRKALEINPKNTRAMYNIGDAFLSQQNNKDATEWFTKAAKAETNKTLKAMMYHNIGYIHHLNKEYDQAIEAYKEALRNNPHDEDTRYNLALCQKQKKDQQDQQQQQQNQQNQQDQQQQQNQQDQQQQQNQNQQMPQDNIDQLLNLARQSEQQTRKKLEQAKQPRRKQLGKNW